jgi:hypothetical protein
MCTVGAVCDRAYGHYCTRRKDVIVNTIDTIVRAVTR